MSTKFALLDLLSIKKMSAYELAKFAKESIGYFGMSLTATFTAH